MKKAKRLLFIFVFISMFLIGGLSVKAFECEYEGGSIFYFEYNSQTKKYTRVTKNASFKVNLSTDINDINVTGTNIITKLNEACSKGNLGCSGKLSTINWKKSEYGYVAYDTVKQGYCPAYMAILMPRLSKEYSSKNNPYSILGKETLALYFAPNEEFMNKLKNGNEKVEVVYGKIKQQPNHPEQIEVKEQPTSCR